MSYTRNYLNSVYDRLDEIQAEALEKGPLETNETSYTSGATVAGGALLGGLAGGLLTQLVKKSPNLTLKHNGLGAALGAILGGYGGKKFDDYLIAKQNEMLTSGEFEQYLENLTRKQIQMDKTAHSKSDIVLEKQAGFTLKPVTDLLDTVKSKYTTRALANDKAYQSKARTRKIVDLLRTGITGTGAAVGVVKGQDGLRRALVGLAGKLDNNADLVAETLARHVKPNSTPGDIAKVKNFLTRPKIKTFNIGNRSIGFQPLSGAEYFATVGGGARGAAAGYILGSPLKLFATDASLAKAKNLAIKKQIQKDSAIAAGAVGLGALGLSL